MKKVLVVDDDDGIRIFVKNSLEGYDVEEARDGEEAIEKIKKLKPDVVLLDISMPKKDGIEVLREIRKEREFKLLPILVMTALDDKEDIALKEGANYFITKPFSVRKIVNLVSNFANLKEYIDVLEEIDDLLLVLAKIAEAKDGYTEGHLVRVKSYSLMIGEMIGLSQKELWHLEKGAILHDIGKIGIPDKVLFKPSELTFSEYEMMKSHTIIGYEICSSLKSLREGAALVPLCHQERWDGRGYPRGLKGEEIPLLARIVTVADAFDAMTTDRVYRKALSFDEAFEQLTKNAGKQFDPKIVEVFLNIKDEVIKVALETREKYDKNNKNQQYHQ